MRNKAKPVYPQIKADLIEEVEEEITFTCPVRGSVTQKVKVMRYAPVYAEKVLVMKEKGVLSSLEEEELHQELYGEES